MKGKIKALYIRILNMYAEKDKDINLNHYCLCRIVGGQWVLFHFGNSKEDFDANGNSYTLESLQEQINEW